MSGQKHDPLGRCPMCGGWWGRDEKPLTPRQRHVYGFITSFLHQHGYAPSFEDIRGRFGYRTLSTVHEHLQNLERKGWIRRQFNTRRSIEPLVPVVTVVAV